MKIIANKNEPYSELLCKYVQREFPEVSIIGNKDLIDILTDIIIGTKEVRYGPLPSPESLVVIREAIRESVNNNLPIRIMVPWGSIKANFSPTLDIAELSAVNRLLHLSRNIERYYKHGVEIVIRVEDQSGYELFSLEDSNDDINESIKIYSASFNSLVDMLSPDKRIRVVLESSMENAHLFETASRINTDLILRYLHASNNIIQFHSGGIYRLPEYIALVEAGWIGIISYEQREHYLSTYRRLYQDWNENRLLTRLAIYLGGALTRKQLGMTGVQSYWGKYIQLVFLPPTKGVPEGYNSHYIYYRTLPLSEARTNIPAWRAKGYLKISGNSITPKLLSWSDKESIAELTTAIINLYDNDHSVNIRCDYLLED